MGVKSTTTGGAFVTATRFIENVLDYANEYISIEFLILDYCILLNNYKCILENKEYKHQSNQIQLNTSKILEISIFY